MRPGPRASRRSLLRLLLGSPLWLAAEPAPALEWLVAQLAESGDLATAPDAEPIREPSQALHVFDFEPAARRKLSPAHWAFLAQGVHDEFTLEANREVFGRVQLRPRRLVDVRELETSTDLLGQKLATPIVLAPCGAQRAFHPEGEIAVARAARKRDHLQILSTGSSASLEEVVRARGAPVWFQLYTLRVGLVTRWQIAQAEEAGCPAVVLTVDTIPGAQSNRDRIRAFHRADNPACQSCHAGISRAERWLRGADRMGEVLGLDLDDMLMDLGVLDWDYVDRIRDMTSAKLLLKGILTPADARLAAEHGIDAIVVSNHGGRAEDTGLGTLEVLPGVVDAVGGRLPVLVDGGFRRGPDFFKALALGASAVGVGRPYLWGLAAFGQEGVEAVLSLLQSELEVIMGQMGTPDVASITPERVRARFERAAP